MSRRNSILPDAPARSASRSRSRRMSYGCSPSPLETTSMQSGTTDKKDRRAMLEEWRRQARSRNSPSPSLPSSTEPMTLGTTTPSPALASHAESVTKKRARFQDDQPQQSHMANAPPLPPTSSQLGETATEGLTAVQRYKLRRQQGQHRGQNDENASPSLMPPHPPPINGESSTSFVKPNTAAEDVGAASGVFSSRISGGTPLRRLSVSGARKGRRRSMSAAMLRTSSLNTPSKAVPLSSEIPTSEASTRNDGAEGVAGGVDSVEGAGLRSRLQEMQHRVQQLEKEKIALSMSKAPLEAQMRQKEDAWLKQENRLFQEIETLKFAAKEADESYRALENKYSELEEETKSIRFEARKAASNASSQEVGSNGLWARQLQNDRDVQELKEKLRAAEEENKSLKLERVSLESDVQGSKIEYECLLREFNDLEEEHRELEASTSQASDAAIQLGFLTTEHIATSAELNAVRSDLAETKSSAQAALEETEKKWKEETSQLKFEVSVLRTRGGNLDDDNEMADDVEDEAVLRARIEEKDARIAELEAQIVKGEQQRRTMHNRIQELRGNIRVFVRTRPFLPGDGSSTESAIDVSRDGESLAIEDKFGKNQQFRFDKVFPPSSGQDGVFDEVSEFVQSALDGYHVCLFSYGQTGSGKTHTMQGSGNTAMRGIIPRAVEQILTQVKSMESQKWKFNMTASFLEIYNEDLRDLLTAMCSSAGDTKTIKGAKNSKAAKLSIKRDVNGKSYVDGLTHIKIDAEDSEQGMQQLEALMAVAARARSVGSTNMNAKSSRSHSVFMLHLNGVNQESDTVVQGALNLCDLAGSERLDRSGAGADAKRLKETQAINKSLSCLGDVFNALASRSKHVPYRNSKLTYLLQDCLSGDGKALMFVNLSPTTASSGESLCSLRFAQRVNQIELGKPTKHVQYGGRR